VKPRCLWTSRGPGTPTPARGIRLPRSYWCAAANASIFRTPRDGPPHPHLAVRSHSFPIRLAGAVLALALAACDSPSDPPPALAVTAEGRLERGSTLALTATREGLAVPAGQVVWTVSPADAAEVQPGGTIRLLKAGNVTVQASYDGSTGSRQIEVEAPPAVVFDMSVNGNRDLYRVALDGGDFARLTQEGAEDRDGTVAQDRVVFVSFRAGNAELYSLPLAGGTATRLTNTTRSESSPALSPDGQRLAYAYDVSGVARIWTANGTGGNAAAATTDFGFDGSPETSPTWAPTGNRFAYVSTADGTADVWDLAVGQPPAVLAGGDSADVDPSWSADGTQVAFASTRQGDAAIFTVRLSGGGMTKLSTRAGTEAEPSWTADGRLVYVEFSTGSTRLVWIDPADPATIHEIPVQGATSPRRPAVVR
jgi:Tol biopolymer transport system component